MKRGCSCRKVHEGEVEVGGFVNYITIGDKNPRKPTKLLFSGGTIPDEYVLQGAGRM